MFVSRVYRVRVCMSPDARALCYVLGLRCDDIVGAELQQGKRAPNAVPV
jgi:hypothetical protein|eukprot:COSAG06_NODE_60203_length_271_cov_1.494186_1_plen_49_part_00